MSQKFFRFPSMQLLSILVIIIVFFPLFRVFGVDLNNVSTVANQGGLANYRSFEQILEKILLALLSVAFILAIIYAVLSGYRFIVSQGNDEQVTKAKKGLLWAVIGMAVVASAWAIVKIVINTSVNGKP